MEAKLNHAFIGSPTKGKVILRSGDCLDVEYTDPNGKLHTISVTAQHLVLIATHEQSQASLLIRPGQDVHFMPPEKTKR